jgi:SynChlorMet cassette radical SAM/SPASM protein ScmF
MNSQFILSAIYFYLTNGCNLCCRHCWIQPKHKSSNEDLQFLDLGLYASSLKQAKPLGLTKVKLTGGEPLLHPRIQEIIRLTRNEGLGLTLETNGVLCTTELARELSSCKSIFVSVSLDGANALTHEHLRGVKGCFEQALSGIHSLVSAGIKPQIIMTLMRKNKDEISDVVRLAEKIGAGSVKFNILQPVSRGAAMHQEGEALGIEELLEIGRWVENTLSSSSKVRLIFSHPIAFRPLGKILGKQSNNRGICNILSIIGVLSNGFYSLCGIGESLPELVFADAKKSSLEEVWTGNPVLQELRQGLSARLKGVCADCILKEMCQGYCIAENYYLTKDIWSGFWFCEEARKKGFFPQTRIRPQLKGALAREVNG